MIYEIYPRSIQDTDGGSSISLRPHDRAAIYHPCKLCCTLTVADHQATACGLSRCLNVLALGRSPSSNPGRKQPGADRVWWQRLKNALGTSSNHFVDASLQQLIAAARLPFSGISETAVNASLAIIEGAEPRDEVECALVMQMACTHTAAMAVLGRLGGGHGPDRSVATMASAASRLLRTYATQVEAARSPV